MILSKDAKLAFLHATTLFVSYLTSQGIDLASNHGLKTLTHEHVMQALRECGWEAWTPRIMEAIHEYQRQQGKHPTVYDMLSKGMEGSKGIHEGTISDDDEVPTSDHELAVIDNENVKGMEEDIDSQAPAMFLDHSLSSEQSSLSFE